MPQYKKGKVIQLPSCECGEAFFKEHIKIGTEYQKFDTENIDVIITECPNCKRETAHHAVAEHTHGNIGWIPLSYVEIDGFSFPKFKSVSEGFLEFKKAHDVKTEKERDLATMAYFAGALYIMNVFKVAKKNVGNGQEMKLEAEKICAMDKELHKFATEVIASNFVSIDSQPLQSHLAKIIESLKGKISSVEKPSEGKQDEPGWPQSFSM